MAGKTILKARARRSVAVMVEPTTERDETVWVRERDRRDDDVRDAVALVHDL
jgi:hypothetical protein